MQRTYSTSIPEGCQIERSPEGFVPAAVEKRNFVNQNERAYCSVPGKADLADENMAQVPVIWF